MGGAEKSCDFASLGRARHFLKESDGFVSSTESDGLGIKSASCTCFNFISKTGALATWIFPRCVHFLIRHCELRIFSSFVSNTESDGRGKLRTLMKELHPVLEIYQHIPLPVGGHEGG